MANSAQTGQQIIQGVLAALNAAPQIESVIAAGKTWVDALFTNGLISVDVQNALKAYMDGHLAMVKAGVTPPGWTVDPDPVTPPAAPKA